MEPTHGTPPATRLASNVAQPLNILYHRKLMLSNGFLVVIVVYASKISIILFVLKLSLLPQESYFYMQSLAPVSATGYTDDVKVYLQGYVGDYYEIEESAEIIYIGNELPDEFTGSESRKALMGANAKAKENMATAIPELIQIAVNPTFEENRKESHTKNAQNGWYRYDVRFALPVYEDEALVRYNVFNARLLVNHAANGKKVSV